MNAATIEGDDRLGYRARLVVELGGRTRTLVSGWVATQADAEEAARSLPAAADFIRANCLKEGGAL